MTHNLPASIESATSALGALADHTTEIADVLAMAFGLPFAQVAPADSRYGTVTANVERLAGSLDAIAKTAEAASSRLLGLARPVQLDPRPEPCQCQPAAETLTVPAEAIEDDTDDIATHHIATHHIEEQSSYQKTTDDARKDDPGESVIHRPDFPAGNKSDDTHEGTAVPEIEGAAERRPRNRGKAKRK